MTSEAQKKAQARYAEKNTRQINFQFNRTTDADILAKLDSVGNKMGYIKALIRADLDKNIDTR